MGIKFRCPNGHKLNIKTFLAGKRGVCPDCGLSFRIPSEEAALQAGKDLLVVAEWKSGKEGEAEEELASAAHAVSSSHAVNAHGASSHAVGSSSTVGTIQTMAPAAPVRTSSPVNVPAATPAPVPAIPAAASPAAVTPAVDPCAEAPLANWYVRSPAGGQYGPAKGDVMRKWISEGRVSADSLVWREGFSDWRVAVDIFPTLARAGAIGAGVAAAAVPVPIPVVPVTPPAPEPVPGAAARSLHRYAAKRQNNSFFGLVAFFGLIVLCVGLLIVLAIVLSRTYNEPREKSKEKASAVVTPWQVQA